MKEYGEKNLIPVDSPAVNLLSRHANGGSIFRFAVSVMAREFMRYLNEEIDEINDQNLRRIFWEMANQWRESAGTEIDSKQYYEK